MVSTDGPAGAQLECVDVIVRIRSKAALRELLVQVIRKEN
jgi:hypothetical protein